MLLIHSDEEKWAELPEARARAIVDGYGEAHRAMVEAGIIIAAHRLTEAATATTLRWRGGEMLTTDGPFAELKEQLGGFFLLEVADLDEARRWAQRLPGAECDTIEIRAVDDGAECGG